MKKQNKTTVFKKGVWIKEQQGVLTMGSMDDPDQPMIVPESMHKIIQDFESDMIEALYGKSRVVFNPDIVDINIVMRNLKIRFPDLDLKIAVADTAATAFKGRYDDIYRFLEQLIVSSIPDPAGTGEIPVIYINASILDEHLCIIFRDSLSISRPERLEKELAYVEEKLQGKISYKSTSTQKSYYDIMIPPQK